MLMPRQETPIYRVFQDLDCVSAAFTRKGTRRENYYFSFQRSRIDLAILRANVEAYGRALDFDPSAVTWPNGRWPHSGQVIIAERQDWAPARSAPGIVPVSRETGLPLSYDGIATASPEFVLGVQGADCPSLFLCDPGVGIIGAAHAGWKPTVRGVVPSLVAAMTSLGASASNMLAFLGPGVGDRYNEFAWDLSMEPHIKDVFVKAGRPELPEDHSIRHVMSVEDRQAVCRWTGRPIGSGVAFMLSALIAKDLVAAGLVPTNIDISSESTIVERYADESGTLSSDYRYHSAQRDAGKDPERPRFGSSLCVMYLRGKVITKPAD